MQTHVPIAGRMANLIFPMLMMMAMLPSTASAAELVHLVSGLEGASGSTIGPGGALYVTEGAAGCLSRVDPQSGEVTRVACGLPQTLAHIGYGGAVDVAFIGGTAYALVTLVAADVGGNPEDVVGIYRVDGPNDFTLIADIGTFSASNPPATGFFIPTGVQYAIEVFRNGFLVTDGHHNRLLLVNLSGDIAIFRSFENIVPTGLAVSGNTVYMAQAGPIPHEPEDGKVVALTPNSPGVEEIASGAPLLVDVEFGRGRTLYGLAQGIWEGNVGEDGTPAQPNTGSLVQVNANRTFMELVNPINLPSSLELIGNTAYIVTLTGDIFRLDDVSSAPFGNAR